MSYTVELVKKVKSVTLGEGPHWDIPSQTLYFVDIMGGSVHSYKPSTDEYHSAVIGDGSLPVSLIIPVEGVKNRFVISVKNDLAVIDWDGKSPKTSDPKVIGSVEEKDNTRRINDGKADPKGRIWAGTMNTVFKPDNTIDPVGSFYKVDNSGKVTKIFSDIYVSNGLAWSSDNKKFFYIDSFRKRVDSYDYDLQTGEISNEKPVFDFQKNNIPGLPDGMTIDAEGKLFVACYWGSHVLRVDPESGELLEKISMPASQITSVAFGGPNLDELYVTSANVDNNKAGAENGVSGYLYKIKNLGVKGLPMYNVKLSNI